jgi:lipopolysaccharide transport system permease protein
MEQLTAPQPVSPAATPTPKPETIRLEPTKGFRRVFSPRELWRYRDLGLQIAVRDVTIRYRQTAFGAAWAILQPIAFMAVFTLIFSRGAGISSDGLPYALFSLCALVPWMFFANAFLLSSESLVMNQALISKIYFPRIFIPAGVVAAGCVDFSISLSILFVILLVYGSRPRWGRGPRSRRSTSATATSAMSSPSRPSSGSSSAPLSTRAASSASRFGRSRRSTRWSA